MGKTSEPKSKKKPISWESVREIVEKFPKVEESTSYGTPAFKVKGKLFVRLHDSGESFVVRIDPDERELRMRTDPEVFFITDHYLNYPWVLVKISTVSRSKLKEVLSEGWRLAAPPNDL